MSGKILAQFIDYPDMLDVLRARLDEKGICHQQFDAIVGVAVNYTNATLGGTRKKPLGAFTMLAMFKAAGLRLAAIDAPELMRETGRGILRGPIGLTRGQLKFKKTVMRENGRKGGLATQAQRSPSQRSESGRYAALVRYYGNTRRGRSRAKLRLRAKQIIPESRIAQDAHLPPSTP